MTTITLRRAHLAVLAGSLLGAALALAQPSPDPRGIIDAQIAAHAGSSGAFVLDRGVDALIARGWLADNARSRIDVQYFIWSTDNVGVLATEGLLRAAERGVQVRVIVDDLLVEAPDESLLALDRHPRIDIRIYNPQHKVGTPLQKRMLNIATDFRGVNQRMHDKTFLVDGQVAITGGRNMADEYFDHDHEYNFRDRDALLLGPVVGEMEASFARFWTSPLAVPVAELYDGIGILKKNVDVKDPEVQRIYRELHAYAASPANFAPEIRTAIASLPTQFPALIDELTWGRVDFLSDKPGKNDEWLGLGGGGLTTTALAKLAESAQRELIIQSPYLVLSDEALALFGRLRERGVRVRISTNSLASTDNLQAFSGYRSQRNRLLKMGLEIHEYRPDPAIRKDIMQRYAALEREAPVFALHAKTMVVDGKATYIGTYNLDPRSQNLNTEVGVVIHDTGIAQSVARAIETDMLPANSWNAADSPDDHASFGKRSKVRAWQMLPLKPLL